MRGQRHVPAALYPRERPGTHCTGGWVGPSTCLDMWGKSRLHRDSIPRTVQPVASRYTDYAINRGFFNIIISVDPGENHGTPESGRSVFLLGFEWVAFQSEAKLVNITVEVCVPLLHWFMIVLLLLLLLLCFFLFLLLLLLLTNKTMVTSPGFPGFRVPV